MDVRTRQMEGNCELTEESDGAVVLWLRAGMLPRRIVCELGVLLMPVVATRTGAAGRAG